MSCLDWLNLRRVNKLSFSPPAGITGGSPLHVPARFVAFETLMAELPALTSGADVLCRAAELDLDGESLANDPGICRKIEAVVRDTRGRDLSFGCR